MSLIDDLAMPTSGIESSLETADHMSAVGDVYSTTEAELEMNPYGSADVDSSMDFEAGFISASGGAAAAQRGGMYGLGGVAVGQHGGIYAPYSTDPMQRARSMRCGPNPEVMSQILSRTGYPHEVTGSLRRYGGPPPDWTGPKPTQGVEVSLKPYLLRTCVIN